MVGLNHGVNIAALSRNIGAGHVLVVKVHEDFLHVGALLRRGGIQLFALDHHHRGRGPHHRDLGGGPGQVDVARQVFRPHDRVGPTISLAHNQGNLRHRGLHQGKRQLGAAVDQAHLFLLHPGQVAGGVHDEDQGDVVGVANANEAGGLVGGISINTAGGFDGLVGHHPHRSAINLGEGGNDVGGESRLDLLHVSVVEKLGEKLMHVVAGIRVVGHERIQLGGVRNLGIGLALIHRARVVAGQGQAGEKIVHIVERILLIVGHIGNIAVEFLLAGPTQIGGRDDLTGDLLNHRGARDIHFGLTINRNDEIRGHRRIHGPTRGLAHHDGNLGAAAAERQLAAGNLGIHGQRRHRVLDTGPTGVLDTNDWATDLNGHVHDLAHFPAERHTHAAAVHGFVVRVHHHRATINPAVTSNNPIRVGGIRLVGSAAQGPDLHKRTRIQQPVDALAGSGAPRLIAAFPGVLTTRVLCLLQAGAQVRQLAGCGIQTHHHL